MPEHTCNAAQAQVACNVALALLERGTKKREREREKRSKRERRK
jgi:hypothetical protein